MSAPLSHDPLTVTLKDNSVWRRRAVTDAGLGLYAVEGSCQCPEYLLVSLAELAVHGIQGMAHALPVPVGPKPSERDRLRAAFVEALDNASRTHPCPTLGDQFWSGCVHYDEAGHVTGVGSCHSERRADAVLDVWDAEMERLRTQVAELNESVSTAAEALRATATQALPWAHVMPDGDLSMFLDDLVSAAMNRWRTDPDGPVPDRVTLADIERVCREWRTPGEGYRSDPEPVEPAPIQAVGFFDGVPVSPPSERPVDGLTATFAPVAAYREDPHDSPLHHDYRIPHDLPLGCGLTDAQVEQLGNPFLDGGAS